MPGESAGRPERAVDTRRESRTPGALDAQRERWKAGESAGCPVNENFILDARSTRRPALDARLIKFYSGRPERPLDDRSALDTQRERWTPGESA
jgi:hypothetical protein